MATKDELEKENAELKERIGGLERELEDMLESATGDGNAELLAANERAAELQSLVTEAHEYIKNLKTQLEAAAADLLAAQERIKELEAQQEAAAANGGDEALIKENAELKAENEKLQAALEGGVAKDGGKEARGESIPDFLSPDYTGPVDVTKAEKIAAHRKAEAEKGKGK